MKNSSNKETILFVHIPKTAGTTLRGLIYPQYGDNRVASVYEHNGMSEAEFSALSVQEKNNIDVVIGHFGYGFHRNLEGTPRSYRYATIVRDPMKRFLSLYNHLANVQFKGVPPNFREMLKGPMPFRFNNYQTRLISGASPKFGQCDMNMLELAINRIENEFDFVGVTELFNESLVVASEKWGWKILQYRAQNMASRFKADFRNHLSDDDLDLFTRMNALDIELYEYCKNKLLERMAEIPDGSSKLKDIETIVATQEESPFQTPSDGGLDVPSKNSITGWARLVQCDFLATVRILINDSEEYVVRASKLRIGLRQRQIDLRATCGFVLNLPREASLKQGDKVGAWCVETGQELSNSPQIFYG